MEDIEDIEILRFFELDKKVMMVPVSDISIAVDVPSDVEKVENYLNEKMILNKYETIIFDCDGVILNSNIIKTEGFFEFALSLGKKNAEKLVNYHIKNGGISRYEKIKYFYKKILNEEINEEKLNFETNRYSKIIQKKLMKCSVGSIYRKSQVNHS